MSELGVEATRGVSWPSNGLTEIPFRLYTDPDQYRLYLARSRQSLARILDNLGREPDEGL